MLQKHLKHLRHSQQQIWDSLWHEQSRSKPIRWPHNHVSQQSLRQLRQIMNKEWEDKMFWHVHWVDTKIIHRASDIVWQTIHTEGSGHESNSATSLRPGRRLKYWWWWWRRLPTVRRSLRRLLCRITTWRRPKNTTTETLWKYQSMKVCWFE